MCVCAIVPENTRLTEDQVEKMWESNSHGAGIAWREKDAKGKTFVRWEKGLELEQIQKLIAETEPPYVVHFRIPSVGDDIAALTHPFTIDNKASVELSGKTYGRVLFHNGHWNSWRDSLISAAVRKGDLPVGKWSDSRAMAYMAYVYGLGILELIDEKVVAFGPNDIEVFRGTMWSKTKEGGIWVSNTGWEFRTGFHRGNRGSGSTGHNSYHTTPPHSMCGNGRESNFPSKSERDRAGKSGTDSEDTAGPGGNRKLLPLTEALAQWKAGTISKKQFKRAKRAWEQDMRQLKDTNGGSKRSRLMH